MAHEALHEDRKDLGRNTRDMHRALVSLQEELEAIDWYRQRVDACGDAALRDILAHNMGEETEHAAMLIEWLRRNDSGFADHLRTYLFTELPVTAIEEQAEADAADDETQTVTEPMRVDVSRAHTIGTLKE
ncbi:MAG: ferritin [Thiogranum sp.]|nr:ferritin [Thiogranum sp.]